MSGEPSELQRTNVCVPRAVVLLHSIGPSGTGGRADACVPSLGALPGFLSMFSAQQSDLLAPRQTACRIAAFERFRRDIEQSKEAVFARFTRTSGNGVIEGHG